MIGRCTDENDDAYKNYGGRGITICDEWRNDFQAFCKWARENGFDPNAKPMDCTIDRIDNDKGYSPENCRWVDFRTQARNRSDNRVLEFNGEKHIMTDWAKMFGLKKTTLRKRLNSGWSIEDALTKPIEKCKSHPKMESGN